MKLKSEMAQILVGIIIIAIGAALMWYGGTVASEGYKRRYKNLDDKLSKVVRNEKRIKTIPVKQIIQPRSKKIEKKLGGIILEGTRRNILGKYSLEIINKFYPEISSIRKSKVAPDFDECVINISPDKSIILEFKGTNKTNRADYTFSFIIYKNDNNFDSVNLTFSILNNLEKSTLHYEFNSEAPFQIIPSLNLKTYRPSTSYFFSDIPSDIIGSILIHNQSEKMIELAILAPVIEEGLFTSHPVPCGEVRPGNFLSYERSDKLTKVLSEQGTISFLFKPYWDSRRLTPNFDPHFFYWMTDNEDDGIKIFSDSNDNGKIKALIMKNGKASEVYSDITPVKGEIYSLDFRYKGSNADLVINGRNISSLNNLFLPSLSLLPKRLYIGSNPKSEHFSAFSVIRDFRIYDDWLSTDEIRLELYNLDPNYFQEFKKN